MSRQKGGFGGYRGRRTLTDILRLIAVVLTVLVILVLAGLFFVRNILSRRTGAFSFNCLRPSAQGRRSPILETSAW